MKVPKLFAKKLVELNDNPKSAPVESWMNPPDPRPTVCFDNLQIEQIGDWKTGNEYELEIKVKMIRSEEVKDSRGIPRIKGTFVITHVGVEDLGEGQDMIDANKY